MIRSARTNCLIVDLGGVLLTDSWNHQARKQAAASPKRNSAEIRRILHSGYQSTRVQIPKF